jgi:ACR3 family arsenite transporter
MIYPTMLRIDLASILGVRRRPGGILVTLFVNWLVKPFSMALLGWLSFKHVFRPWIDPALAGQYVAGTIILAAAPCTAMVFVWSYLTDGDLAYTLVQVSLNDLIMLVLFAPIVGLLVAGASDLHVPFGVLLASVVAFIVIPLALGSASRVLLTRAKGREWFERAHLPRFRPVATAALLATLVLIFAFQADNITDRFLTWRRRCRARQAPDGRRSPKGPEGSEQDPETNDRPQAGLVLRSMEFLDNRDSN